LQLTNVVFPVGRNNTNHEYNINNKKLVNATEVVDLEVTCTVDSNMRFDKHVNKIVTHQRSALIFICFKSMTFWRYTNQIIIIIIIKNLMFCLELLQCMCIQF